MFRDLKVGTKIFGSALAIIAILGAASGYLIYQMNDCWGVGARFEWYQNEGVYTDPGETASIYALTLGTNYKPTANIIIRPEIRWDRVFNTDAIAAAGSSVLQDNNDDQTTFGIDTIFLF